MFGVVDLLGLFDWSMVQPQHNIVIVPRFVKVWSSDGDWLIGIVGEDGEGAGGVEADTFDRIYIDVILSNSLLDAIADTSPDVRSRLFLSHRLATEAIASSKARRT